MSVLIKDMEMPKACVFCELYEGETHWCRGAKKEIPYSSEDERADDCPLVEIPPHGRLIDKDKALDILDAMVCYHANIGQAYDMIDDAPTIIESTMGQANLKTSVNKAEESE